MKVKLKKKAEKPRCRHCGEPIDDEYENDGLCDFCADEQDFDEGYEEEWQEL